MSSARREEPPQRTDENIEDDEEPGDDGGKRRESYLSKGLMHSVKRDGLGESEQRRFRVVEEERAGKRLLL